MYRRRDPRWPPGQGCRTVRKSDKTCLICPIPESQNRTSRTHTDNTENTCKAIICQEVPQTLHSGRRYAATLSSECCSRGVPCPNHRMIFTFLLCVNRRSVFYSHVRSCPISPKFVSESHFLSIWQPCGPGLIRPASARAGPSTALPSDEQSVAASLESQSPNTARDQRPSK